MTLSLPGQTLSLSLDVPGSFPADLQTISDPELAALLGRVDPTRDFATFRCRAVAPSSVYSVRSNGTGRKFLFTLPYEEQRDCRKRRCHGNLQNDLAVGFAWFRKPADGGCNARLRRRSRQMLLTGLHPSALRLHD